MSKNTSALELCVACHKTQVQIDSKYDFCPPAAITASTRRANSSAAGKNKLNSFGKVLEDRLFELVLGMLVSEFEKTESVVVLDCKYGLRLQLSGQVFLEILLTEDRFFKSLIFNLVDKYVFRPAKTLGHQEVKVALIWVFALFKNDIIMRPTNFSRQRREKFGVMIGEVKTSCSPKICCR